MEEIRIEGIDITEAGRHHTGGVENYVELLRLYCMDGRRKLALLEKLLKDRDYAEYGVEIHGLKSSSASLGIMELSRLAREQEEAVKRKDTAYVTGHVETLLEKYSVQLQKIEDFLENWGKMSDRKEKSVPLSGEEVLKEIKKAVEQLEDFHSRECTEVVGELLEHRLDGAVEAQLREVREQLMVYEDDEAEQLLLRLAEQLEKEE